MQVPKRNQSEDAQYLYDERSTKYDDSHHPRFARHTVEFIKIQPGEHVLDLACGTGLITYLVSTAVGASGSAIGVDISTGMLAQANAKKPKHDLQNLSFYEHSITELDSLEAIRGKQFDVITCCSALVLLEEADQALKHWVTYLKPGGRLITDATHPNNLIGGLVTERVGRIMGRPIPCYRERFQTAGDLQSAMEDAGLHFVDVKLLAQQKIEGTEELQDYLCPLSKPKVQKEYSMADSNQMFDQMMESKFSDSLASPQHVRDKARALFKDEWAKVANSEGKVQWTDAVWIGIGWKG